MKKISFIISILLCICFITGCVNTRQNGGQSSTQPEKTAETLEGKDFTNTEDISYVMIYNPNLYDETIEDNEYLSTGDFSEYVEAVINKADELAEPTEMDTIAISEFLDDIPWDKVDLSGDRAGTVRIPYSEGDTHDFYCGSDRRTLETFECKYAGDYCNVWTYDNSIGNKEIDECGKEFDENIYEQMVDLFGEARFIGDGGKLNILVYSMPGNVAGFFVPGDLFTSYEMPVDIAQTAGFNTDHAIINVNSRSSEKGSVIAHEFQHLICFTDTLESYSATKMRTWLNEAMSGYVEEVIYPGAKMNDGHYEAFTRSNRIRHGQSMYNFDTTQTRLEFDIGVYGSVYLFSEYLVSLAGDNVFSDIHSYWRDSRASSLDEATAIVNSVSDEVFEQIDQSVDFSNIDFDSDNEQWLSKLTLNFYISLLKYDKNDPDAYKNVKSQTLLYDEINPADIEGGGRVIAALKEDNFDFPEDADNGLVYVGLDKNFNVITEYIIH